MSCYMLIMEGFLDIEVVSLKFDLLNHVPKHWRKPVLLSEFFVLFLCLPIVLFYVRQDFAPYLILLLVTLVTWCLLLLLSDHRFKRFRLWNIIKLKSYFPTVLKTFGIAAIVITLASWHFTPDSLFFLPQHQTLMWLGLLVLYPLLSAWPQEVIFRTFFFHRYKKVFKDKSLRAILSAIVFALAHLMFANWIAVVGSFFAGLVFAFTYMQSRSTLLVAIEHSLWGCWLFTAGLGAHFDSTMLT